LGVPIRPTFPTRKYCPWWITSSTVNLPLSLFQSQSHFDIWRQFLIGNESQHSDSMSCLSSMSWMMTRY
jgi:hypothetical protein